MLLAGVAAFQTLVTNANVASTDLSIEVVLLNGVMVYGNPTSISSIQAVIEAHLRL